MSDYDMKIHSNPDAQAWAKFFIHTKEEKNWQIKDIDESLMLAWFANAMMAMHDHLKSQRTWVGLTGAEITTSIPYSVTRDKGCFHAGALWADDKLKEKNT